jgi:hypothetical protein
VRYRWNILFMRILFLAFFLLIITCVNAQTGKVRGRVVDKSNIGISDVRLRILEDTSRIALTDLDGNFQFTLPANQEWTIFVAYEGEKQSLKVTLSEGEFRILEKIKLNVQSFDGIEVRGKERDLTIDELPVIEIQSIPGPQNSVEQYLVYTTAARSSNELTNNYNVRGGSYEENLIYVNGFEIYRPFLTRSGEQEGMSFINPNLVSDIAFSAGGFAARYGDRLSSVLDITYRTPERFRGSFDASFLGLGVHIEDKVSSRFNYMVASRYQDQGYVLNALPVKGSYRPRFFDFQVLTNYAIRENLTWSVLGHFSSNSFRFAPETQDTRFGTINQALSFRVFFQGQEVTRFQTMTGATSLKWKVNRRTNLDWYVSVFNTDERETFDVLGQYFINQVETDPSKEEFGDSIGTLGVGSFLNHARNSLQATLYTLRHEGGHKFLKIDDDGLDYINRGELRWGASVQFDDFYDVMSEWRMIDSAGYSIPQSPSDKIELFEVIKAENYFKTVRTNGFLQFERSFFKEKEGLIVRQNKKILDDQGNKQTIQCIDTVDFTKERFFFHAGIRTGYTAFNDEFYITPRVGFSYFPSIYYFDSDGKMKKRSVRIHGATGLYYQPPIYRELRFFDGELRPEVLSQKSLHVITGVDYTFEMWDRTTPFKVSSELFYKYMWDVNPYLVDNVRTRYFATNDAVGYAYGMDMQMNGEFVPGLLSFFKVGILRIMEDLLFDDYYDYFNSDGQLIIPGFTFNSVATDSILRSPGFIPKPTDQLLNIATLFQDNMPGFEQFTVQLGLNYGSRLPYGPPDRNRYRDTLRQRPYFRVDIGFGYDMLYKKQKPEDRIKMLRPFKDARLNFEIFNLLGINNVLSQQWIQDTQGRYYAIPNYLTQRRFNVKLILRW